MAKATNTGDKPASIQNTPVREVVKPIREYRLSGLETFWYYLSVITTMGFWYTIKVTIKKAMSEKWDNQ